MINIILTIVLGSLAGVAAFLSCVAIWRVNPFQNITEDESTQDGSGAYPADSEIDELNEGAMLQLSVNIRKQELALAKEGTTVTGSYINIERNRDGMQTSSKIFLN